MEKTAPEIARQALKSVKETNAIAWATWITLRRAKEEHDQALHNFRAALRAARYYGLREEEICSAQLGEMTFTSTGG